MARIRTIKPEFFTSLTIAGLTLEQRLTFIGLWTHADDEGRCVDDPRLIKAAIWPLDDRTAANIETDLSALAEAGLIHRYHLTEDSLSPHGALKRRAFIVVSGWAEHQRINRPTKSRFPAPEQGQPTPPKPATSNNNDSLRTHGVLSEDSPPEQGTGNREGNRDEALRASRAPARATAAQLAATAVKPTAYTLVSTWAQTLDPPLLANEQRPIAKAADELLANGARPDILRTALDDWATRGKTPGFLKHCYTDAAQAARAATTADVRASRVHQPARPSTTDQRVADIQALKNRPAPDPDPRHLRSISGAAS